MTPTPSPGDIWQFHKDDFGTVTVLLTRMAQEEVRRPEDLSFYCMWLDAKGVNDIVYFVKEDEPYWRKLA